MPQLTTFRRNTSEVRSQPSPAVMKDKAAFLLPIGVWVAAGGIAIWGCFSSNPVLTPFAIIVLVVMLQLLWRHGEPPVLAFACTVQWLQASATIFYTDFYKVSLEQANGRIEFETATWLSLIGVFALAVGMRTALLGCRQSYGAWLAVEVGQVNVTKAFIAYLVCFTVGFAASEFSALVPSLAQPFGALVTLKWVMVFVLTYAVLEQRNGYPLLTAVIFIELALGLLGFFAAFKNVFFILLIVAMTSPLALRGRRLVLTAAAAVGLFFFGVVWSAVKAEYRDFINAGTEQQVALVSTENRMTELGNLVGNLSWDHFTSGLDNLVLRVGYTNLFALTLMNVPGQVPYENGRLWLESLKHIAMPRLLFPEKASVDDSERATLYTGVQVAGAEQGTSIGIGYIAESYVDFGPFGMFGPIFPLGFGLGFVYRAFVVYPRQKLLSAAVVTAIIVFNSYAIETSNIKIVGGTVTMLLGFVALLLTLRSPVGKWLFERKPSKTMAGFVATR
jgi:hypothetical protein